MKVFMVCLLLSFSRFSLSSRRQKQGTTEKKVSVWMQSMFWSLRYSQVDSERGKNHASMLMIPLMRGETFPLRTRLAMTQRTVPAPQECPTRNILSILIFLGCWKMRSSRLPSIISFKIFSVSYVLTCRSLFLFPQNNLQRVLQFYSFSNLAQNSILTLSWLCWMETTMYPWVANHPHIALQLFKFDPRPWLKIITFHFSSGSQSFTYSEASPRTGILILNKKERMKLKIANGILDSIGFTQAISYSTYPQLSEGIHLACSPSAIDGQNTEISYCQFLIYLQPALQGPLPTISMWQNLRYITMAPSRKTKMIWKVCHQKQSAMATRKKIGVQGRAPSQMQLMIETSPTMSQKYFLCSASKNVMLSRQNRKSTTFSSGNMIFFMSKYLKSSQYFYFPVLI